MWKKLYYNTSVGICWFTAAAVCHGGMDRFPKIYGLFWNNALLSFWCLSKAASYSPFLLVSGSMNCRQTPPYQNCIARILCQARDYVSLTNMKECNQSAGMLHIHIDWGTLCPNQRSTY